MKCTLVGPCEFDVSDSLSRSTGGQRKRFKDNLKAFLKKFNIDPAAFERLSADRRTWRSAVISGATYFGDCYRASAVAGGSDDTRRLLLRHTSATSAGVAALH